MTIDHGAPVWRARWWLVPLFLLHSLPFLSRPALVGGDEVHYALMAHSLAVDHDFDLQNDYSEVAHGSSAAGRKRAGQVLAPHLRKVGGREIFAHPVGVSLLLAPLVFIQQGLVPGSAPDLLLVGTTLVLTFAALLAGWRALGGYLGDRRRAAVWVFGCYFASPLWFYSRTFFTESYTWSFAVFAASALAARRPAVASVLLGLLVLSKGTAVLLAAALVLGGFWLLGRRQAAILLIGPGVAAAALLAKNLAAGVPPLTASQPFQLGDPLAGALGLLGDGRHGLLLFAPLLLVGAVGGGVATWTGGDRAARRIALLALGVFLAYFLVDACWVDWRGGSCYGPRLLVPVLPPLVVVASRCPLDSAWLRRALGLAFVAGFTVAFCAALDPWRAFWGASAGELVSARPLAAGAGALLALAALGVGVPRLLAGDR